MLIVCGYQYVKNSNPFHNIRLMGMYYNYKQDVLSICTAEAVLVKVIAIFVLYDLVKQEEAISCKAT